MESTSVYWVPVWRIQEPHFKLKLINPFYFVKQLPGHKSDVKDAQWIAECMMKELVKEVHGQDAGDFSSWAGLKPRNDQSNKTIKSRRITHGNRYLRRITMHHNYAFLWVLLLVQGNYIRFYRGKVLLTLRMSTILPPYRHIIHPTLVKNHLHFHTFLPKSLHNPN